MNIEETMIAIDGRTGPIAAMTRTVGNMGASARRGICLLDARLRTLSAEPEEGATTAEYAVVLEALLPLIQLQVYRFPMKRFPSLPQRLWACWAWELCCCAADVHSKYPRYSGGS